MSGLLVQKVGGKARTSSPRVLALLAILAGVFVVMPAISVHLLGGPVWAVRACAAGLMPAVSLWILLLRRALRPSRVGSGSTPA